MLDVSFIYRHSFSGGYHIEAGLSILNVLNQENIKYSNVVRELVRFRQHDLLSDPPPAPPYDLITCRNVVIYFERPNQERLYHTFADALRPGRNNFV